MTSIEDDNLIHLNRFKYCPPSPSYIAGFIDGDGCIFIRKISDGYQSGISIAQCRTNILQVIRYHFGGSITSSKKRNNNLDDKLNECEKYHKHNVRNEYNLMIRSNNYELILNYLQGALIVKEPQFQCLFEMKKYANLPNKKEEKEKLYSECLSHKKKSLETKYLSRLNIEYISGLFDAEGCLFINQKKIHKFYISISQKSHPELLFAIVDFLGFGKVVENKFIIYDKNNSLKFIRLVKDNLIVKFNQAVAFEKYLTTDRNEIKLKMYEMCNEEKHKIEIFTSLNISDSGKEGYFDKIRIMTLKENVNKDIIQHHAKKDKTIKEVMHREKNTKKDVSDETKQKMSLSIRTAKDSVSDDVILQVRKVLKEGKKNVDVQSKLNLPRHTVTRIKNGLIVCRDEKKVERIPLTQEEINMSKRKIKSEEILMVVEKLTKKWSPMEILEHLINLRNKNNIPNTITIDIVKNIKRKLNNFDDVLYESELSKNDYEYYKILLNSFVKTNI